MDWMTEAIPRLCVSTRLTVVVTARRNPGDRQMSQRPETCTHATAREAYAFHQERAKAAITRIQELLAADTREFETDYRNWEFPKSLSHVATEIESVATIAAFIAGKPR
jgi:hypothetical protein